MTATVHTLPGKSQSAGKTTAVSGAHASLLTESGGVHSAALASVLKGSVANLTELEMREIRREAAAANEVAIADSLALMEDIKIEPPCGPVESITLPDPKGRPVLKGKYHVVVTNDYHLYGRWQTLVNYHSYKRLKAEFPDGPLGGFTRLMHSSRPDDVLHLVPTIVVDHLPDGLDRGYGPMHRPWAFTQWLLRVHIPEEYIFMSEPDHIFISPPPLVATPTVPAAFPFFYVDCERLHRSTCMHPDFNPRQVAPEHIKQMGNSPVMIYKETLAEMLPIWDTIVRAIHANRTADKTLGWAQEMYAFTLAMANLPGGPSDMSYHQEFMVQPPFDKSLVFDTCSPVQPWDKTRKPGSCTKYGADRYLNVSLIHYTYGQDFDLQGRHTYGKVGPWHWCASTPTSFNAVPSSDLRVVVHGDTILTGQPVYFSPPGDKRDNAAHYPRIPVELPPAGSPQTAFELINRVNEAGANIPYWRTQM